jgi:predicted ATPase/DNA-binding CsgD family transcriptional regulator
MPPRTAAREDPESQLPLPRSLTTFVGRSEELGMLVELLSRHRLVTVTGPGGSGKTRIAFEVARQLAGRFEGGVALVELAPLGDPAMVSGAVAQALGVRAQAGRSVLDTVTSALAVRHVLLVLDNCEHLLDGCAEVGDALLQASPDSRVLATSREPLGVEGEARYRLPPLGVPPDDASEAASYPAVGLFEARALQADAAFTMTDHESLLVGRLVRQLDGMPLAIELAAARVDVLTLDDLLDSSARPIEALVSDSRRVESRQRSLHAAIDWSYQLLGEPERRAFRRLSVFPGRFTLQAASAVCGPEGAALVTRLVRSSLLTEPRKGSDGQSRYGMLQTIRAYAFDQLEQESETDEVSALAAGWQLRAAEAVAGGFRGVGHLIPEGASGDDESAAAQGMDCERDNLRSALDWLAGREQEHALALALCLAPWWLLRARNAEGAALLQRAIDVSRNADHDLLAAGEVWLGLLAREGPSDSLSLMGEHFERAVELASERAPSAVLVDALCGGCRVLIYKGRGPEARERAEEALAMAKAIGYASGEALAACYRGCAAYVDGDYEDALRWVTLANEVPEDALSREASRLRAALFVDTLEGLGDDHHTERVARAQIKVARDEDDRDLLTVNLDILARVLIRTDRRDEAAANLAEGLRLAADAGNFRHLDFLLETARSWAAITDPDTAAVVWGAHQKLLVEVEAAGVGGDTALDAARRPEELGVIVAALGEDRTREAEQQGERMPISALLERVQTLLAGRQTGAETYEQPRLSARERELLALVAEGLTNAQIAERLFISIKTVQSHLDRIRDKTGARRRPELTRLALELVAPRSASG